MSIRYGTVRLAKAIAAPALSMSDSGSSFLQLKVGGRTWDCADTDCFIVKTWTTGAGDNTLVEHVASEFSLDVTTSGSTTTVSGTKAITGGTLSVTLSFTVDADDQSVSFDATCSSTSSTRAVDGVEWPRMAVEPAGDPDSVYAIMPVWAGYSRRSPHLATSTISLSMPAMSNWFALTDSSSRCNLYFYRKYVNESVVPFVDLRMTGGEASTTSTTVGFRHMGTANRTVANTMALTSTRYSLQLRVIETTGDGRTGWHDCLNYYQQWALERSGGSYARGFMPSAKWFEAGTGSFAANVAAARVVTRTGDSTAGVVTGTTTPGYTFYTNEATRLKANLGSPGTDIIQMPNMWHANVFDTNVPAHTPQRGTTAMNTYITAVQALGVRVCPYVNVNYYETTLASSGWSITDFDPGVLVGLPAHTVTVPPAPPVWFGDIRGGMLRSVGTNTPQTAPIAGHGAYASWDFSRYNSAGADNGLSANAYNFGSALAAPVVSYLTALGGLYDYDMVPDSNMFYCDQISGITGSAFQDWGTSSPFGGGNHGKFVYGKRKDCRQWTDTLRTLGKGMLGEAAEEQLLTSFNMTGQATDDPAGIVYSVTGCAVGLFRRTYGDFQRGFDFAPQVVDATTSASMLRYVQMVALNWLRTGMLCYLNDTTPAKTETFVGNTDYSDDTKPAYLLARGMRAMYATLTYTEPYVVKGALLRPMSTSWELDAPDSHMSVGQYLSSVGGLNDDALGIMPHAVYRHATEDDQWGIVAINFLTVPTGRFRIVFEAKDYDMPPAEKILRKNNQDGTTTEILRFRHAVDTVVDVVGGSVALYEVLMA